MSKLLRTLTLPFALIVCALPALAASVSGVVTNKTTGKPSAGDDVVLIRLQQGMQEAARTRTDAKGKFTLDVPDDGLHLIRVTHDKANYFQAVQDTTQPLAIDVYSAAAKVKGIANEADIIRMETEPGDASLKVTENFFVKNDSDPPMTQMSDAPFDFYLPAGAVIGGSAALAPGGMPVQASPVPLQGAPGHYAFIFPIRPGETRFQIQYTLPYSGSLKFAPKLGSPTDTIAVILPKSMKFAAGPSVAFTAMADEVDGQTYVARNAQPSQPLDFTVSGTGQLPRDTQATQQAAAADAATGSGSGSTAAPASGDLSPSEASARQRADTRPGVGLNNPLDSDADLEPWAKYKWWIIGLLGVALAGGAGFMMRTGPGASGASAPAAKQVWPPPPEDGLLPGPAAGLGAPIGPVVASQPLASAPNALLQALKDELFELETERLSGTIGEAAYAEHKAALEVVLRRALARSGSSQGGSAKGGAARIEASANASKEEEAVAVDS